MNENTLLYWVNIEEYNIINNAVINLYDNLNETDEKTRQMLNRIQTELSVSETRNENSIFPPKMIFRVLNIPSDSLAIRLTTEEVKLIKSLPIPDNVKKRLS